MDTNKYEFTGKVVVSILAHTTQKQVRERKTINQSILKDNLSCISCLSRLKYVRVHLCSFVVLTSNFYLRGSAL